MLCERSGTSREVAEAGHWIESFARPVADEEDEEVKEANELLFSFPPLPQPASRKRAHPARRNAENGDAERLLDWLIDNFDNFVRIFN